MSGRPRVAVCVVSHDSAADLPGCLAAVGGLDYRPLELVVVDCASGDGSLEVARRNAPAGVPARFIGLDGNAGFAGGMNVAVDASDSPLVLSLNPDARPRADFVDRLVGRLEASSELRVAAVTGRLTRPPEADGTRRLDACGMRLTWTWRHLDRASGRIDRGQLRRPQRVFGATGAASLFVRRSLDDAAVDGAVFDPDFHTYREDAELCFRLRRRGWEILYEPRAVAVHGRVNLPDRRRSMPPAVNLHSLKNRYLLRAYHQSLPNLALTLVPALWRDLLALAYVLVFERTSLPAYSWLWRHRRRILARRRQLRRRGGAGLWALEQWFVRRARPL